MIDLTEKQISILRSKLKKTHGEQQWCGYLTIRERIFILSHLPNHLFDNLDMARYDQLTERMNSGEESSSWFYFKYHKNLSFLISNPHHDTNKK